MQKLIITAIFILAGILVGTLIYENRDGWTRKETIIIDQKEVTSTQTEEKSQEGTKIEAVGDPVEQKIRQTFPEDQEIAIAIAKCENGYEMNGDKWNVKKVGDHNLKSTIPTTTGTLGTSHGIFQIRNGGNDDGHYWNRAESNDMTLTEFNEWMHDPEENIEYARQIYDKRGWSGWHNCAVKTLAYNQ